MLGNISSNSPPVRQPQAPVRTPAASAARASETVAPVQSPEQRKQAFLARTQPASGPRAVTQQQISGFTETLVAVAQDPSAQALASQRAETAPPGLARALGQPVKAVYAIGSDAAVETSATALSQKVSGSGVREHQRIGSEGLASLCAGDKLTIVAHGSPDGQTIGGLRADQLADHLQASGLRELKTISLKSCDSAAFAESLFRELQSRGIRVERITGREDEVALDSSGRTLVRSEGVLLHQARGGKIEVTAESLARGERADPYAGRSEASASTASLEGSPEGRAALELLRDPTPANLARALEIGKQLTDAGRLEDASALRHQLKPFAASSPGVADLAAAIDAKAQILSVAENVVTLPARLHTTPVLAAKYPAADTAANPNNIGHFLDIVEDFASILDGRGPDVAVLIQDLKRTLTARGVDLTAVPPVPDNPQPGFPRLLQYVNHLNPELRVSGLNQAQFRLITWALGGPGAAPGAGDLSSLRFEGSRVEGRPAFSGMTDILMNAQGRATIPTQHKRHIIPWHGMQGAMDKLYRQAEQAGRLDQLNDSVRTMISYAPPIVAQEAESLVSRVPGATATQKNVLKLLYIMNSNPNNLWPGDGAENSRLNSVSTGMQRRLGPDAITNKAALKTFARAMIDELDGETNPKVIQAKMRAIGTIQTLVGLNDGDAARYTARGANATIAAAVAADTTAAADRASAAPPALILAAAADAPDMAALAKAVMKAATKPLEVDVQPGVARNAYATLGETLVDVQMSGNLPDNPATLLEAMRPLVTYPDRFNQAMFMGTMARELGATRPQQIQAAGIGLGGAVPGGLAQAVQTTREVWTHVHDTVQYQTASFAGQLGEALNGIAAPSAVQVSQAVARSVIATMMG